MNPIGGRERRWWNQLRCARADESAAAAFALAELLWDRDREDEAETVLRECARSNHDRIAAAAMIRLARLVERRRGPVAAGSVYDDAAERASASESGDVLIDLAARWVTLNQLDEAICAYRAVARDCPNHRLRAVAGYRLGTVERESGHLLRAIRAWEIALGDAEDALRVHLLVSLGEARLEQAPDGSSGGDELLAQAIASDHPDLAPQAALRLARFKRAQGELIDAYQLTQLVVDSEHPLFGPDAEAESKQLIQGELNALLELEAPNPRQLSMESLSADSPECRFYLTLPFSIQTDHRHLLWIPACRSASLLGDDRPSPSDHRLCQVPRQQAQSSGSAFLWKAILGRLSASDLWTVKDAIKRDRIQFAQMPIDNIHRTFHGGNGELEFLFLLRVAAWLKNEASPQRRSVSKVHFQIVFDQTSQRLEKLLDDDQPSDPPESDSQLFFDPCGFGLRDAEAAGLLRSGATAFERARTGRQLRASLGC